MIQMVWAPLDVIQRLKKKIIKKFGKITENRNQEDGITSIVIKK